MDGYGVFHRFTKQLKIYFDCSLLKNDIRYYYKCDRERSVTMTRQILLSYEEPWYIAKDIDTNVASQGKTMIEAQANLKEALELYFEDTPLEESNTNYYLGVLEVV